METTKDTLIRICGPDEWRNTRMMAYPGSGDCRGHSIGSIPNKNVGRFHMSVENMALGTDFLLLEIRVPNIYC